jgi:hypothetical protein
MPVILKLRAIDRFRSPETIAGEEIADLYEVDGLPEGHQAFVARISCRWQILRFEQAAGGDWSGDFSTSEDALAALQTIFSGDANSGGVVH